MPRNSYVRRTALILGIAGLYTLNSRASAQTPKAPSNLPSIHYKK